MTLKKLLPLTMQDVVVDELRGSGAVLDLVRQCGLELCALELLGLVLKSGRDLWVYTVDSSR